MIRRFAILGLCSVLVVQSCTAVAVTAVIRHRRSQTKDSATTQVAKSADEIYDAELRALEASPDVRIVSRDPEALTIEAMAGNDQIRSTVREVGDGRSELLIDATSPDPFLQGETPAVDLSRSVFDQLGIDYDVQRF